MAEVKNRPKGLSLRPEIVTWQHPERNQPEIKEKAPPRHDDYSTIQPVEYVWVYDMRPFLPRILDTPTLMIVATDVLTMCEGEVPAFGGIATAKTELFVQQRSTHMSMYSKHSRLAIAAKEAADWYRKWLIEEK